MGVVVRERVFANRVVSEREVRVLQMMADGLTNEAISRELGYGSKWMKNVSNRLYRKLDATCRAHAVAIAFREGLVS